MTKTLKRKADIEFVEGEDVDYGTRPSQRLERHEAKRERDLGRRRG